MSETADESFTLIADGQAHALHARLENDRVALAEADVETKLGWVLKPQGLCRGEICVPVSSPEALRSEAGIDLAEFAQALGRPLALDYDERTAAWVDAPTDRRAALESLEAPDFTLPDIEGKLHSLSEHRGKKVLLVAYASW